MIINSQDQKKPLSHYFFKGEGLKRFYDTIARGIGIVNSYFTISYLSVFQFGLYQLILAFINIAQGFNLPVLDSAVAVEMRRYFNEGKKDFAKRLFWENAALRIGIAVILTAVVFLGAELVARWYHSDIALFVRLASLLFIIDAMQTVAATFFKSVISFSHWSYPAIREGTKFILIISAILFYQFTIIEVIGIHVIGEAAAFWGVFLFMFIKQYRRAFREIKFQTQSLIFQLFRAYGQWIILRHVLSRVSKNTLPWFIKFFINTEAVAFYTLAVNLVAFMEGLMPLDGIAPILLLKAGKREEMGYIFKQAAKYTFWLGVIFLIIGFFAVPPIVAWLFPHYLPAIPIFRIMLLALPIFGAYKLLKTTLSILQEHRILTLRFINEVLIIPIGSAVFLPLFRLAGIGLVYIAIYAERVWYFYTRLIKYYPEFKIKPRVLLSLGMEDWDFLKDTVKSGRRLFFGWLKRR